jgi:hypothetical protein
MRVKALWLVACLLLLVGCSSVQAKPKLDMHLLGVQNELKALSNLRHFAATALGSTIPARVESIHFYVGEIVSPIVPGGEAEAAKFADQYLRLLRTDIATITTLDNLLMQSPTTRETLNSRKQLPVHIGGHLEQVLDLLENAKDFAMAKDYRNTRQALLDARTVMLELSSASRTYEVLAKERTEVLIDSLQ